MKAAKRLCALLLTLALVLSMVPASLAAQLGTVTGDCVRVHAKPEIDSKCYDQVHEGDVLEVVDVDQYGWAKVRFVYSGTGKEMTGYLSADYLDLREGDVSETTASRKTAKKAKKQKNEKAAEQKKAKEQADEQKKAQKQKDEQKKAAEQKTAEQPNAEEQEGEILETSGGSTGNLVGAKKQPSMMADSSDSGKRASEPESASAAPETEAADASDAQADTSAADTSAQADASAAESSAAQAAPERQAEAEEDEDEDSEISSKVSYTATVNDDGINLRKEPSLEAEILTKIPEGELVIIRSVEDEEGWMKVLYYDSEGTKFKGYMLGEYLDINSIGMGRSNVPSVIVRESPDNTSTICGVVPKGKKVDVFASREGWYRIEYKDLSGWVQADCITVEGESDCEGYCRVKVHHLKLREEANKDSGVLAKIPENIVLQVTDKSEADWYVVNYNGHTGYVSTEYVEDLDECSEGYVQSMASSLSLRTGAGSSYARLTTIPQGTVLPVSGTVGDWYEVKYGRFTGYVSGSFVSATTEDGFQAYPDYVEIKGDDVVLREEPNEDAKELEDLPDGTLLAIQGIRDGWYLVTYDGESGYVSSDFAKRGTKAADMAAEQAAAAIAAGGDAATQFGGSGSSILSYAAQYIGNPYVWGGTSLTNGADCSGFVKSILAHFGIDVPHSSAAIRGCGRSVSESEMQPGDIVCYSGHVGIYAGNGRLLSALGKKYGITYNSVHYKQILSVRRFT